MTGLAVLGGFVLDTLFGDPAWLPSGRPQRSSRSSSLFAVRNGTVSTASSCPMLHGTAARTLSTSTPSRIISPASSSKNRITSGRPIPA